jgi:hypothetical protein
MGRVHRGEVRIHAETFGQWWERWLIRRRPYLAGCGRPTVGNAAFTTATTAAHAAQPEATCGS